MKRFGIATAMVVALMLLCSPWANAQLLEQVPADALVVFKFNKLKATSDKIAAMSQKLGIAAFRPELNDPLGAAKQGSKVQQGIDETGDAAFVIANGPMQGREPSLLLFVPVTDYKAFVGNFADAKTEGEVTAMHFAGDNNLSYSANWGKYAVVSPRKELVSKKPAAGMKVAGSAAKELDGKDIVIFVNMKSARDKILPEMEKGKKDFLAEFERNYKRGMVQQPPRRAPGAGGGAAPAAAPAVDPAAMKYMPLMRSVVSRAFDVAQQLVKDSDAACYGISISTDGIKTTALAEFTAGSPSASTAAKFKGSDASMLAGLPKSKYLFVGGMAGIDAAGIAQLLTDFTAPFDKDIAALGTDGKPLQDYMAAMKEAVGATKSSAFGMLVPSGALGQSAIFQMVSVSAGDSKVIAAAQQKMMAAQQTFMDLFQPPQMRGVMKVDFKAAAKTVDGVALNEFSTQFVTPAGQPQSAQLMQMKQMMTWFYGPGGMKGYLGAIDAGKMIAVSGVTDATISQLIAAAKANQDNLSAQPSLALVQKQLPPMRVFAGYFALDQFVGTIANYAKMFGMPVNVQLPQDLPPVGFTVGGDAAGLRADGFIPAQTMQSIIAAGIQSYMQMQGGQAPGGPGGL